MVAMADIDRNKDGMRSRQHCMDTGSKVRDPKATKMTVKWGRISAVDVAPNLTYRKAGA